MKKLFLYTAISLMTISLGFAQNETDALRYSQFNYGGTARFNSMGGAFGALGGDFSALSVNPAGIGIYRKSEISFTPVLTYNQTGSTYFSKYNDDMKYDFNFGNIGVVFAFNRPKINENGWQGFQLGFGYNRHTSFENRTIIEGFNNQSSLMTQYLDQAIAEGSTANFDPFTTLLAWDAFLIDQSGGEYFVDMDNGNVNQRKEINTSGNINEYNITFGGNYGDLLYLGASFGFPRIRYEEESTYEETDAQEISPYFNSLQIKQNLTTKGSGFNFKIGAIIRPIDPVRIGVSFHSPTFYDLTDRYSTDLSSDLSFLDTTVYSPEGRFDYELTTPLRLNGSLGFVLGKIGLISFDYEMVDYSTMRLRSGDYMFSDENSVIREVYDIQHNLKAGGEIRLSPIVLRAGYALYGSPYKKGINDGSISKISGGFGLREEAYFLDFAYVYSMSNEDYYLYSSEYTPAVKTEHLGHTFLMTLGFKF